MMIEVLWLGRGGQGAFTAAKLLGAAYTSKGEAYYALAFPSFGPERRGAPVRAFTKLSQKPVVDRSQTEKADYIIILDETLYSEDLKEHLKPDGKMIINTKQSQDEKVVAIDGNQLASKLHLPTTNTVMLGAIAAISGIVSKQDVLRAIEDYMPKKIQERNKQAVLQIAEEVAK